MLLFHCSLLSIGVLYCFIWFVYIGGEALVRGKRRRTATERPPWGLVNKKMKRHMLS